MYIHKAFVFKMEKDLIVIGRFMRPHGVQGYIKCMPETHDLNRYTRLTSLFVYQKQKLLSLEIEDSKIQNGVWLFKFKGFDSPESLKVFTNQEALILNSERIPAPPGHIYFSDAADFQVALEDGTIVGKVLEMIELPSVNAFCIRFNSPFDKLFSSQEILVPWIDACVVKMNEESKTIFCDELFLKSLCTAGDSQ